MSRLRQLSLCLALTCSLAPRLAAGAPPEGSPAGRAARESEAVELLARGGDAGPLLDELRSEGPGPRIPQVQGSREAADVRGALESLARRAQAAGDAGRRAAAPAAGLADALAAYDRLRAADLLMRERFHTVAERIAAQKLGGEAAGRLAAAQASYTEAADRILGSLGPPAEAARKALHEKKSGALTAAAVDLARALEEVGPALAAAAAPEAHPILRASVLPYRRAGLAPRAPVTAPAVQPSYLDPTGAQPTAADRTSTADAALAPEILAKAAELEHDYTRIYQFVRNEIRTEAYAGGMKGAVGTLAQGSGNDVDQASLLIALLRASDAPARYVHGVVELPVETLAESLGVPPASVPTALAKAGVAHTPIVRGGRVAAVQLEQTWVSAYIPYTNYRGAVVDFSGKSWVPLAPALKGVADVPPTGILRRMAYSVDGAIAAVLAALQTAGPLAAIRRDVEAYLTREAPGQTWDGQLGSRTVKPETLGLLPSSLPMTVVAVTGESAQLAPALSHRVRLLARAGDADDAPVILDLTLPLSAVASHRLTLSYLPATVDDQHTVDSFGGLSLVPAYLVDLRPQIRLDGQAVAVGEGAVDMAAAHRFEMVFSGPYGEERVEETVVAGGYYALGIAAQQARRHVAQVDEVLDPPDDEYLAARLLSQIALGYSERWDRGEAALAGLLAVSLVRPLPTVAVAGNAVSVESLFGLPYNLRFAGVTLDAALRVAEPLARGADAAAARDWMRLSALEGSALEHMVFEQDFLVDSISADKGLGVARQAGIDVLRIDAQNAAAVLPALDQPAAVKEDIRTWVGQGMVVDVPHTAVARADWRGSVWRVEEPASGAAGYFLSGGLAGGATAVQPDAWVLAFLADALRAPSSTGPNTNPLAGREIRKVFVTDEQIGEVDKTLVAPLEVLVRDFEGRPVKGASVTFTSVEGGGHLLTAENQEVDSLTVRTDSQGVAAAPFKLGAHTADNPIYVKRQPGDENTTQALQHLVDVTADSLFGPLVPDSPFSALGFPGPAVELKRTDTEQTVFNTVSSVGMWADTIQVQARDRLGNPVSNVGVTFQVAPLGAHDATCANQPRDPRNGVVFDPTLDAAGRLTHCPSAHPLLGECGDAVLAKKTSARGVAAGVILGNSVNYTYTVDVLAEPLPALRFSYREVIFSSPSNNRCETPDFRFTRLVPVNERGDRIAAARAGRALEQPIEVTLLYWRPEFTVESSGGHFLKRPLADGVWQRITGRVSFQVGNGGQASPAALTEGRTYQTRVTTGATPGTNAVTLNAVDLVVTTDEVNADTGAVSVVTRTLPSVLFTIQGKVLDVWGVEPKILGVQPTPIPLTSTGRAAQEIAVGYTVDPPAYVSNFTEMDLLMFGTREGTAVGSSRSGAGLATIQRGFQFFTDSLYEARLVLNRGSAYEIESEKFRLPTHAGLFFNVHGDGHGMSDVTQTLFLSQDVDLVNQRYCPIGGDFRFTLSQQARVSLTVRPVDAINTDQSPVLGPPRELFRDVLLEKGEHSYVITPAGVAPADFELPPGTYQLELHGVSVADGGEETYQATAISKYTLHDSLPIGHAMVQGVDLWDGHLALSREDFRIPGRGAGLEFQRTYSSNASDDIGPLGAAWSHNYESRVIITSCGEVVVIGGEGGGMRFISDGAGGFKPLKAHHGTLVLDRAANAFDFYSKNGNRYHYVHGVEGDFPLAYIQDPDGNTTTLEYDRSADRPQLVAVRDAAGRSLTFRYDRRRFGTASGAVLVQVEGPEGIVLTFDYDVFGNLIRAARENGSRVETYTYAVPPDFGLALRHKIIDVTNALNGAVTHYDYAEGVIGLQGDVAVASSFVTKVREAEGGETAFSYDPAALSGRTAPLLTVAVTDPRQKVTTYRLNQYGSPLEIEDPLHHTTRMEWEPNDVVMTGRTDGNGVVTSYTYDAHGNQLTESVSVTDVDGETHTYKTELEYWPPATFAPPYIKDRIKSQKDRNGTVTTSTYDARGHLTGQQVTVANVDGGSQILTTAHTYLPSGDLSSTTDPRHNTTTFIYDNYGNVAGVTDPLHGETATEWNARSLPVLLRDALGRETRQAYDTLGRPTTKTLPKVAGESSAPTETTVYDDASNQVTQTDAEGRVTRSTSDRQGRLLEIVNPLQAVKSYEYDLAGNKTKESNWHDAATPRTDAVFTYDDAGRLVRRDEPLGRITEYAHDAVGNLTRETLRDDSGGTFPPRVTDTRYDALNRKIQEDRALGTGVVTTRIKLDGNGNKIQETDPLGRVTTYRYDGLNRLLEKIEPEWKPGSPKTTRFLYDGNGNLIEERRLNPPADQIRKTEYDELNRPRKRIDAEGKSALLEYDAVGNVTRQIDARLNATLFDYDARNRRTRATVLLNRITQPARQVVTEYGYDKVGNRTFERQPNGNEIHQVYNHLNRPLSTTDSLGLVMAAEYDANGNKTLERDANGHETHNVYDALFRLIEQSLPEQRTLHFTYDAANNKISQTDARDHTSRFEYDRLNRLTKTIDPAPFRYETTYAYDAVGNKTDETDRRGHTTHFDYDALNRLVKRTDPAPLSFVMTYGYDAAGNRVSETDRRGIVTESSYDRENRPTQTKRAGLALQRTEYDDAGNKRFVTDANGNVTSWEHDERNLAIAENRPLAAITRTKYDDMGDPSSVTDPEGRTTTYVHDARRRLTAETNSAEETTAYAYDLKGNRTRVTRPEQAVWLYRYDDADRLKEVEDPLHGVTKHAYDRNGNRTEQTDAENHKTTFEYDELDRVTAKVYQDLARETYHFDENGNRTELIDAKSQHIASTYDALNRETLLTYTNAATPTGDDLQSIATVYDANNNPLTITETYGGPTGTAITTKTYDSFDRLQSVTDRLGKKLAYTYDPNGNRKSLEDPDKKVTRYDYDALNRLTAVTLAGAGVTTYDYFRDSRLKRVTYPNASVAAYTYDAAARTQTLDNRQTGAAAPLSRFEYTYDKNGNRTQQIETNGGAPETTTYTFDTADRLLGVIYPTTRVAYTYDDVGNRLTEKEYGQGGALTSDKTFDYDDRNRLLSVTNPLGAGVTYTYDANGNRITRQQGGTQTELIYDIRDKLTEVRSASALVERYAYDYQGLRIRKAGSGALLRYVYDDDSVLLQTDDAGNTLTKYDYGPDRLLSLAHATEGRQFYLFDSLGSVVNLTTAAGALQARYQYDAWGNDRGHTGTSANVFGFTGHELDAATGLYYFKARFYDAETGAFLTEDAAPGDPGTPASLHRYLYGYSNPTVYIDPTGNATAASEAQAAEDLLLSSLSPRERAAYLEEKKISGEVIDDTLQGMWDDVVEAYIANVMRRLGPELESRDESLSKAQREKARQKARAEYWNDETLGISGFIGDFLDAKDKGEFLNSWFNRNVGPDKIEEADAKIRKGIKEGDPLLVVEGGGKGLEGAGQFARTALMLIGLRETLAERGPGFRRPGAAEELSEDASLRRGVSSEAPEGNSPPAGNTGKPAWLQKVEEGQAFNNARAFDYPYREVYIEKPGGKKGYYKVDGYDPVRGEIVSRKLTDFSRISSQTGVEYVNELARKYPPGARIANVPSSGPLAGQRLRGQLILEVPPQSGIIPKVVLDTAKARGVVIRDVYGKTY